MYTEVSRTQRPSNEDRCQQFDKKGGPTYATASKPSNRGTECNKYSHSMLETTSCKHLMIHMQSKLDHAGSTNIKTVVGSNSQVHYHQQELQDAKTTIISWEKKREASTMSSRGQLRQMMTMQIQMKKERDGAGRRTCIMCLRVQLLRGRGHYKMWLQCMRCLLHLD